MHLEDRVFSTKKVTEFVKELKAGYFDGSFTNSNRIKYVVLENEIIFWDILQTELPTHEKGLAWYAKKSGTENLEPHGGGFIKFRQNNNKVSLYFYEISTKLKGPVKKYFLASYAAFQDECKEFDIAVEYDNLAYESAWKIKEREAEDQNKQIKKKWWQLF